MLEEILRAGFAEMGLPLSREAEGRFRLYYDRLEETNKVMNLTAISGEEDSARLHFLDSAAPLLLAGMEGKSVIDVGTGAGFPGLPLKILCPSLRLTLLDSLNKRVDFLSGVCAELGFGDVDCVHARAEDCGQRRETYDYAVSRAVARLNVLCELCLPYVKVGGAFLALKGPAAGEEIGEADKAIAALGGRLERVFAYAVPGVELRHNIVVIRKLSPTPKKYPRRFALIKKSPL
ncbi:MAG: 16S rRNA (guanine(527)-N(7))-methyltransferase RsmG [Oscillospiraceae bacterium]